MLNQFRAFSIQSFGLTVACSGDIGTPLALSSVKFLRGKEKKRLEIGIFCLA
jgi:hypothetical protein